MGMSLDISCQNIIELISLSSVERKVQYREEGSIVVEDSVARDIIGSLE